MEWSRNAKISFSFLPRSYLVSMEFTIKPAGIGFYKCHFMKLLGNGVVEYFKIRNVTILKLLTQKKLII